MARTKSTPTPAAKAAKAEEPTPQEQVVLTGRLCADPVLRHTKSGKAVTTIRVAVTPPEGEASFHTIVAWERTAETVCEYLRKGRGVEVAGRPSERAYTAADGSEHQVSEIIARRVTFLSAKALQANTPEKEVA